MTRLPLNDAATEAGQPLQCRLALFGNLMPGGVESALAFAGQSTSLLFIQLKVVPTQGFVQQQLEDPLFILGPCKLQEIEYQALTAVTGGVQQAETDVQPLRQQCLGQQSFLECGDQR